MGEIALGNIVENCGPAASHLVDFKLQPHICLSLTSDCASHLVDLGKEIKKNNIWFNSSRQSVGCESKAAFVHLLCVVLFSLAPIGAVIGYPKVPVEFPNDSSTQSYLCLLQILGFMNFLETLFIYCWGLYYILHGFIYSWNMYHTKKELFVMILFVLKATISGNIC